jgi:tripartite-type tricarboxylate transporter receptor subunit TctC
VQSGSIRALAVTSAERSRLLPEVATVREAGFPALEAEEWFGILVAARTPAATASRLNGAIRAAAGSNRFTAALSKLSVTPATETPEQFTRLIRSDFERWGPIVQASGFSPAD